MNSDVVYTGRDLEAMSFAVNYHRWILQIFEPYLGMRLVEVGAGVGSFSELLLERPLESLVLVEPAAQMYEMLTQRMQRFRSITQIQTFNAMFSRVAAEIETVWRPDSILYINVLEHVADDEAELRTVNQTLVKGGRIFIFVPALRWLYGSFDRQIGHVRRYSSSELTEKCGRAGFKVLESRAFDFLGIAPWWIKYRLFKSRTMEPAAVRFYDEYVVPFARAVEGVVRPPIGKNIILVGEKI
jgi:SAM-dependent methyltransferase